MLKGVWFQFMAPSMYPNRLPIAETSDMKLRPLSWSSWLQLSMIRARAELFVESVEKLSNATPRQAIVIPIIGILIKKTIKPLAKELKRKWWRKLNYTFGSMLVFSCINSPISGATSKDTRPPSENNESNKMNGRRGPNEDWQRSLRTPTTGWKKKPISGTSK